MPDGSSVTLGPLDPSATTLAALHAAIVTERCRPASRRLDGVDMDDDGSGGDDGEFALLSAGPPRRELHVELDGTRSLAELLDVGGVSQLALTVLPTRDRGVVRRGALEAALEHAAGDAMDVDGMGFEALLELGERIGGAEAEGAHARLRRLDAHSRVEAADGTTANAADVDARRCSICLEEYVDGSARRALRCGHGFHRECIDRWITEHSWCPNCKVNALDDMEATVATAATREGGVERPP